MWQFRTDESQPLISIIMPAYNAERYIAQAVDSVLAQSWKNWELLLINDGSTDGTGAYCDRLTDPRIRVFHQSNQGVSAARNTGLDACSGEFITFMDADDVLPHQSIERRLTYLLCHPEVDILDCTISFRTFDLCKEVRRHTSSYYGDFFSRLIRLDEQVFACPFYVVRHDLVEKMRFKPGMTHAEDLLFFTRIACGRPLTYGTIGECCYIVRTGHGSAMSKLNGLEDGYLQYLDAVRYIERVTPADLRYLRWRLARIMFLSWGRAGHWLHGLRAAVKYLGFDYEKDAAFRNRC